MVAVAGGARRCAVVPTDQQKVAVNALAVFVHDLNRKLEFGHEFGVRMTMAAGVRHIERVGLAGRLAGLGNRMGAVAVDAHGNAGVPFFLERLAVPAGPIGRKLVGPKPVGVHSSNIRVAITAQLGNRGTLHVAQKFRAMIEYLHSGIRSAFVFFFASVAFLAGHAGVH
jgi:hypothetical protein